MDIPIVLVGDLHTRLGFTEPLHLPASSSRKPLTEWKMEDDDAPIFRYLYRNFRPRRHLEFGTWQGTGVLYCLEECDATVWTINLLRGELRSDGTFAYGQTLNDEAGLSSWKNTQICEDEKGEQIIWHQTDSLGLIGRYYMEKGMRHRVCQIYCDSRQWDISNYPEGFFDSALIDGGHSEDVVINDTRKAITLLRSGGLIMWHDFCPRKEVMDRCETPRDVYGAISHIWDDIVAKMQDVFWIEPSWILLGVKG